MDATVVDQDMLDKGVFFDGSSIAGWKAINESDMVLKPDLESLSLIHLILIQRLIFFVTS